ncbi:MULTISPECIES: hypothetical protein [Candidatus Ichthyocystis]|uniref:hypothetical protein n=1 Tax=Candidatus Ichthyocystis TaxID=2929841 RepID=UPI000B834729|nr:MULTISPECIES: hypothetical protein [Ichthyocystis]
MGQKAGPGLEVVEEIGRLVIKMIDTVVGTVIEERRSIKFVVRVRLGIVFTVLGHINDKDATIAIRILSHLCKLGIQL